METKEDREKKEYRKKLEERLIENYEEPLKSREYYEKEYKMLLGARMTFCNYLGDRIVHMITSEKFDLDSLKIYQESYLANLEKRFKRDLSHYKEYRPGVIKKGNLDIRKGDLRCRINSIQHLERRFLDFFTLYHALKTICPNRVFAIMNGGAGYASIANLFGYSVEFIEAHRKSSERYKEEEVILLEDIPFIKSEDNVLLIEDALNIPDQERTYELVQNFLSSRRGLNEKNTSIFASHLSGARFIKEKNYEEIINHLKKYILRENLWAWPGCNLDYTPFPIKLSRIATHLVNLPETEYHNSFDDFASSISKGLQKVLQIPSQ
ncbi:phosphoribosyltransferase [Candidatus Pacearchaeota archaeon]|nr:phosphoribosyltransferase [Candidatus Pacearchaeota archaeon]